MAMKITDAQWRSTRTALRETGDRLAALVSVAPDPRLEVTEGWSVADTVAHLAVLSGMCAVMAGAEREAPPIPDFDAAVRATTVDTVAEMNAMTLEHFTERDPGALVRRVRDDIDSLLRASEDHDPARPVDWLGGSQVPFAGVLAHLLNELQIHGRDIALALRARWPVPPAEAALFFELFLLGVTSYGYGRLLEPMGPQPARRIAVRFHSRYTAPVTMALHEGRVTVEHRARDIDVHLFFDPATLNLMLFGRIGRPRAALTGKVIVWGRRPWLLPTFLRIVHLPS